MMATPPAAQIIAVGSELLTPTRLDTNSLFLTEQLNRIGVQVERKMVVGDRGDLIADALQTAVESKGVVFVTGGTGTHSGRYHEGSHSRIVWPRSAL